MLGISRYVHLPISIWSYLDCHSCIISFSAPSFSSVVFVLLLYSTINSDGSIPDNTSTAGFDTVLLAASTQSPIFLLLFTSMIHPICLVQTGAAYNIILYGTVAKSFLLVVFAPPVFGMICVSLVTSSALLITLRACFSNFNVLSK